MLVEYLLIALQDFGGNLACCDFAQCGYGRLVVAGVVYQRCSAVFQLAGAAGRGQGKIKVVGDFADTVFYGNTGHGVLSKLNM